MIDLHIIVRDYSDRFNSRTQLRALLRDLYPDEKRQINLALNVYESGIAEQIRTSNEIDPVRMDIFIRQLQDEYGMQEQAAQEGIAIWAKAFRVKLSANTPSTALQSPCTPSRKSSASKKPASVLPSEPITPFLPEEGNPHNYILQTTSHGWVISKFTGFDEAKIVIPNIVSGKRIIGISENAFNGCRSIRELVISEGIAYIEKGAFKDIESLTSIIFPDSLLQIGVLESFGSGAFSLTGIKTLTLPDNLKFIGNNTFSYCSRLESADLGDSVEEIGAFAFTGCDKLRSVTVSPALKVIHQEAFRECSSLKEIRLPMGMHAIEANAFTSCSDLQAIYIPPTVTSIDETSFLRSSGVSGRANNLTIYCSAGSAAIEYAKRYGIKYAEAAF